MRTASCSPFNAPLQHFPPPQVFPTRWPSGRLIPSRWSGHLVAPSLVGLWRTMHVSSLVCIHWDQCRSLMTDVLCCCCCILLLDTQVYYLSTLSFHSPAEFTFQGYRPDLALYLYHHTGAKSQVAIIVISFNTSQTATQGFLGSLIPYLPSANNSISMARLVHTPFLLWDDHTCGHDG